MLIIRLLPWLFPNAILIPVLNRVVFFSKRGREVIAINENWALGHYLSEIMQINWTVKTMKENGNATIVSGSWVKNQKETHVRIIFYNSRSNNRNVQFSINCLHDYGRVEIVVKAQTLKSDQITTKPKANFVQGKPIGLPYSSFNRSQGLKRSKKLI